LVLGYLGQILRGHGQKRKNVTHASTTDPDSRLYRKGAEREAKLFYMGHATMENRHGLALARQHQANAIITQRSSTVRVTNHAHKPLDISRKPRFTVVCQSEIRISLHPLISESLRLSESDRQSPATF
jgi:hypothetical protein